MPAPELTAHLDAYLDQLRETDAARYPRRARDYLEDWSAPNRAFVRKYYPRSGADAEFDLTPPTEQAIEWLQSLAPQKFVGTESRLITLFQLLRDLAVGSQDDPGARAKELERRRDELDREIDRVRSGRAGPLDTTQVKERYAQVTDLARRLLADFRQVEENFRKLDLQTRERITTSTQPKGALLEEIFGETDHIHPGFRSGQELPSVLGISDVGTVYFGAYRSSGGWGSLEANNGVLVASDGGSRRLSAPVRHDDITFAGDGWTFTAAPGWVVREGARRGDYEVVRQQP